MTSTRALRSIEELRNASARNKAEELLLSYLNEEQRKTYKKDKYFDVVSGSGKVYRITCVAAFGNVTRLTPDKKLAVASYCFGLKKAGNFPEADTWLMQAMLIACNERRMWGMSNR
jgi:hypothetical protein